MILSATPEEARARKVRLTFPDGSGRAGNETGIWKHPFLDRHLPDHPGYADYKADQPLQTQPVAAVPGGRDLFPIAYLVRQDAQSIIPAHFHRLNQFQVFMSGGGLLGRREAAPITVQYAGAYSGYGPIYSGGAGLDYLVLRTGWDVGAAWLPESRSTLHAMPDRRPRNIVYDHISPMGAEGLAALRESSCISVGATSEDGLAVWVVRIPGQQALHGPSPAGGSGQFWLVMAGALRRGGFELPVGSVLFVSSDEDAVVLHAGARGTELLAMQFPRGG